MRDIPLNDFAIDILNDALWFTKDKNYEAVVKTKADKHNKEDADYYTGDAYFKLIKSQGMGHGGFPEVVVSHGFGIGQMHFSKEKVSQAKIPEVSLKQEAFLQKIQTTFNLKRNALFAVYPPGGYISWHNNANASAFNCVFTWSETAKTFSTPSVFCISSTSWPKQLSCDEMFYNFRIIFGPSVSANPARLRYSSPFRSALASC